MEVSTTTCSFSNPHTLYLEGTIPSHRFILATTTPSTGPNAEISGYPLAFASSTCVTETSGFKLSTDPLLIGLVAAIVVLYTASYVRRVFYS
jgi:hypothetical protein